MARTKKKRWSYSTGERGRNRVRAFEHSSGMLMLEFNDGGKRTRISQGHRDRERAKRQADAAAAKLAQAGTLKAEKPKDLTLGMLFDMYGEEATPTKGESSQKYDRRASEMFLRFFGENCVVARLSLRDWNRFVQDRRSGKIKPAKGKPGTGVGDRMIEQDLRFILAVFNWATMTGGGAGGVLLERNPFKGFPIPKEKNPVRVVVREAEYESLLSVSETMDWRFRVALILAHETGHRIGAIRSLRWSDVDLEDDLIRWRAENEKTGFEHDTPMTVGAREALEYARDNNPGIGETPIFPAPRNPSQAMSRHLARNWWKRAERLAGLEPKAGRGWHSLRRKFASDLMHKPLKVLSQLRGWKNPQTILICYQHPDQQQMREALEDRRNAANEV